MWCETHARPSRASANVCLSSAPTASSGGASATRERRRARTRASAARSARRARPSRRRACGSGGRAAGTGPRCRRAARSASSSRERDRLVGDVAAGHHQRHPDVGQQQVVQRRVGQHHAEVVGARRHRRRDARAGAAGRDARSARSASGRVASRRAREGSRAISANGRSSRCLRDRSRATAASSSARQARWNPPTPLTATIAPERSAWAAPRSRRGRRGASRREAVGGGEPRRLPPPGVTSLTRGPHAGQAFGWAWKRRSRGSSYSAWHAAHIDEAGHRRPRPVVRHAGDDREARAAVRAVDERVAVPAIGRVEELARQRGAGGHVGGDRRVRAAFPRARRGSRNRPCRRRRRPHTSPPRRGRAAALPHAAAPRRRRHPRPRPPPARPRRR